MPNKISIENVKSKLPKFVQIVENSYRGIRYPTKFIDTEYNEEFTAIPFNVIKLQHGCKSRSNQKRRDAIGYTGAHHPYPLENVKEQLPPYLEIIDSTYKSKNQKAQFRDKELNVLFEAYVCNVLRDNKGYCNERKLLEFRKAIVIPIEEIEKRLFNIYQNRIKIVKETYINTNLTAQFIRDDGSTFKAHVYMALGNKLENRYHQAKWKKLVKNRDNYTCQACHSTKNICVHHLFNWHEYPEKRFNINNGITLCCKCHDNFHAVYGKKTIPQDFDKYLKKKSQSLARLANDLRKRN